jgi:hypothetical protein
MVEGLTSSATDQGSAPRRVRGTPGALAPEQRDIEDPGASRAPRAVEPLPTALDQTHGILVTLAERPHPFPSRTRKLSSPAPKILRGQPFGKIGRRQDFCVSGPIASTGPRVRGRARRHRSRAILRSCRIATTTWRRPPGQRSRRWPRAPTSPPSTGRGTRARHRVRTAARCCTRVVPPWSGNGFTVSGRRMSVARPGSTPTGRVVPRWVPGRSSQLRRWCSRARAWGCPHRGPPGASRRHSP